MRKTGASAGVALALAAAALASAGISTETRTQVREPTSVQGKTIGTKTIGSPIAAMRAIYGGGHGYRPSYPNGPGWTQAQVQRRARKARNVKRNRLSHH